MARTKASDTRLRKVSGETQQSSKSSFASLKTFKVTSTFLVAERPNLENMTARAYQMCIGYGRVASLPVEDSRVKVLKPKR